MKNYPYGTGTGKDLSEIKYRYSPLLEGFYKKRTDTESKSMDQRKQYYDEIGYGSPYEDDNPIYGRPTIRTNPTKNKYYGSGGGVNEYDDVEFKYPLYKNPTEREKFSFAGISKRQ